jgi:ankyrin repeat domain-containing protein 50
MKHILLYCQEEFKDHNIAFYFFNARGGPLEKSPLGMLRSLMVQLLEQSPFLQVQFIPHFLTKKLRHGKSEWRWETGELKEFLLREYKRHQCKDTFLLIDALDECNDPDVQEVMDLLEDLSKNAIQSGSNLRICLSSRHYPYIDTKKKIELVVEQQAEHDEDIFKYVQSKLKATNKDIHRQILEKAQHIFIWVVLVVELLNIEFKKGKIEAMRKKLKEIPSNLDELFSKLLGKEDSEGDKATILVFQWVLFSIQPLKPAQLYFAVLSGTDPDGLGAWDRSELEFETIKRFIISASRGLVEVISGNGYYTDVDIGKGQGIVQFIHQSVIDFLTRNQRLVNLDPTLAPKAIGASHARLASCCMAYTMQEGLAIDISSRANSEVGESYPLLEYTLGNLFTHAENAQAEGIPQISLLQQLEKHVGYELLQSLSRNSVKPDKSFEGAQLLYVMSLRGCYYLVRALLLEHETNINAQGGFFGTALQAAAQGGHSDIVTLLLEYKANVNVQGGYFGTVLHAAARSGYDYIATLLLEHGADVNAQCGCCGTALQAAVQQSHRDIVVLLLEYGADVNAQGGIALQAAALWGHSDIATLLLKRGADVNARGGLYSTALQAAALWGYSDIATLLLKRGADVNAQGGLYSTALQAAALGGHSDIVALLLEHGADVNAQGGLYSTALQAAAWGGNSDIVALLLDREANINVQGGPYGTAL